VAGGAYYFFIAAAIVALFSAYFPGTPANGTCNGFEASAGFAGHTHFPFCPIIISA
jgi:hypothetical protein